MDYVIKIHHSPYPIDEKPHNDKCYIKRLILLWLISLQLLEPNARMNLA